MTFLGLRQEDRRDTWVAFVTLLGVMTGHSILETARDALFLASLPAAKLPWAYLAIVGLALGVTAANRRLTARYSKRRILAATLLLGALGTAGFWALCSGSTAWVYLALYVWTGLFATVVVVQFWLLLTDSFDVGQAKRSFGAVGTGGLVGAVLGSTVASGLLFVIDARSLLLVAALAFAAASLAPALFTRRVKREGRRRGVPATLSRGAWRDLVADKYLARVLAMLLVAATVATSIDFAFKSAVAARFAAADLARFFAAYYALTSTLAIVVQLVVAPRLLGAAGVSGTLLLLPAFLVLGSVGVLLGAGLVSLVALKALDGSLRHSVHRTAVEILHLPVAPEVRDRFRVLGETVGQRGGQALASVAMLLALAAGASAEHVAAAILVLALVWLALAASLKPLYLDLFRQQLREARVDTDIDVPDLDLHSMEALLAALSSEDDNEVIAALDLFEQHGKTALLPALILYHPSRDVVLRALALLEGQERADVHRLAGRLVEHEDPEIRAASLHLSASARPDAERLRSLRGAECPSLRAAALVELVASQHLRAGEAEVELRRVVEHGTVEEKIGLARAMRHLDPEAFGHVVGELAQDEHPDVAHALATSFAARPHPRYLPLLVRMLGARSSRSEARDALVALGDLALEYLDRALADPTLPPPVRRHLPRTISRFPGKLPAQVLLNRLPHETDEVVELKLLRGIGRLRSDDPTIPVNRAALLRLAEATVRRAVQLLHWRCWVEIAIEREPRAHTDASSLLVALLREKETTALERAFRMLGVLQPREEFRIIYEGLSSADVKARAGSRELLQHVVPEIVRGPLLALVDDVPDRERLRGAAQWMRPAGFDPDAFRAESHRAAAGPGADLPAEYGERLREMLHDPPGALRSLASYHIAELDLEALRPDVEDVARGHEPDALGAIASGALDLMSRPAFGGAG